MKKIFMILAAALMMTAASAEEIPTVVIAPFSAGTGVEQGEVDIVQKMFAAQYGNTGKAQVVDRSRFNLIQEQLNFQSSDWSNSEKVADFGRALNASQVVTGEFLKLSKGIFVNIQVFDVNTTIIIASISPALIVSDIYDVIDRMPEICEELASKAIGETVEKKVSTTSKDKTAVKENKNLDAVSNEDKFVPKYKIGDTGPGGGTVFFVSEEGFDVPDGKGNVERCHYLEVSKQLGSFPFSPSEPESELRTSFGLGFGKINTYKIISANYPGYIPYAKNCAAYACYEYTTATTIEGDWFLPSLEELYYLEEDFLRTKKGEYSSSGEYMSSTFRPSSIPTSKTTYTASGFFSLNSGHYITTYWGGYCGYYQPELSLNQREGISGYKNVYAVHAF